MITGIWKMHGLFAVSWGILMLSCTHLMLPTAKAAGIFGWMTWPALAMSLRSVTAASMVGVRITVNTERMLELVATVSNCLVNLTYTD